MGNEIVPATAATEINRLHHAAQRSAGEALQMARQAGDLLLEVKGKLAHGEFLPWLEANCDVGERQAQRYMRLAKNWEALTANTTSTSDLGRLGIDGALEHLAEPRAVAPPDEDHRYPRLTSGMTAFCYVKVSGLLIYVVSESAKHPGYWHIHDVVDESITVRPMLPEGVRIALGQDLRISGNPSICRWQSAPMAHAFDGIAA